MTPDALRALIVEILVGVAGGTATRWERIVGNVEELPIALHPRSNWRIIPTGSSDEAVTANAAAEVVRAEHAYVHSARK